MRWIVVSSLGLLVALAVAGLSDAGEPAPPKPADVAEWIRSGDVKGLDRAVAVAGSMSAEQLRQVIQEIRDQTRVNLVLDKKRVRGLKFKDASLDTAVSYLQTITGLNYYVTPRVRSEKLTAVKYSLNADDVSVRQVLDLITTPHGMTACVRQGVVYIGLTEEFALKPGDANIDVKAAVLRKKIERTNVNLRVKEASFSDVVKTLQIQTGFNIVVDPRVAEGMSGVTVSALHLTDVGLATVLEMLVAQGGSDDIHWIVKGDVILITSTAFHPK